MRACVCVCVKKWRPREHGDRTSGLTSEYALLRTLSLSSVYKNVDMDTSRGKEKKNINNDHGIFTDLRL